MNGSLLNPFNITYPTAVQTSLVSGAILAKFDPSGRFVVAGRNDGSAALWDLETRSPVRWLEGHIKAVTSVDWSRNSRFVLTSSKDWNVIVWDLASDDDPPERHSTIRFDGSVISAQFHPRNIEIVLVLLISGDAHLIDLRREHRGRYELIETLDEEEVLERRTASAMTCAVFDPSGRHIFVGMSNSMLLVFNTRTKTMVARHRIASAGIVRGIVFSSTSRRIVTNSSDRTLRQFILPEYPPPDEDGAFLEYDLEPTHRFNDHVNRTAWLSMAYSPDGESLAGGSSDNAAHKIFIWDIPNNGMLATTLDGGREPLTHLDWHPTKPTLLASTTKDGNVLVWHSPAPERWGAFAGGFEEVDENVEYEEREDEFDIEDEIEIAKRKQKDEEEFADILTMPTDAAAAAAGISQANGPGIGYGIWGFEDDEDALWADSQTEWEPDQDTGKWKMKIIMEDDDL